MPIKPDDINVIVATDCGSTTTKAIMIERQPDGGYRQTFRGESPTTVEAPFEDVTMGVLNSFQELQELSGRRLLDENGRIIRPAKNGEGCDIYISTSSAGGGLQMTVAGVVKNMTAESAARAALGAGAIVMETIACNDSRPAHEQIARIRSLRPDMIVLSGGVDGGTVDHVVELAELIAAADPKPRLGHGFKIPVIFAGNKDASGHVNALLGGKTSLFLCENVRPTLESENLKPARDKIHDLFMEHVMQQAPGYKKLMEMTDAPIKPTPGAVGDIVQKVAQMEKINVVGVDIGGATTDVFSVFDGVFNRTVSANLGMSYSISNVLSEAGIENVKRWIPFDMDERELRNAIKNKMIRPTTIPQTLRDLIMEQAVAKEALRLSFVQHCAFATSLKGVAQERGIGSAFDQTGGNNSVVDMMRLDLLVGSGGVLSHAPRRAQTAMALLDSFAPLGVTLLAVDSIFMMPHLGALADIHPEASAQVFMKDCMIPLGSAVAPAGRAKTGTPCLRVAGSLPDGRTIDKTYCVGDVELLCPPSFSAEESVEVRSYERRKSRVELHPAKGFDVGAGNGVKMEAELSDGVVGVIIDCRGRPLELPAEEAVRREILSSVYSKLGVYDVKSLSERTGA